MTSNVGMPVMLGLRTRRLQVALVAVVASCALVRIVLFAPPATVGRVVAEIAALVCLAVAVLAVSVGDADPIPRRQAWSAALVGGAGVALAWWSIPDEVRPWATAGAPAVVFAVVAGLLALRGRTGLAWGACAAMLGVAVCWSVQRGSGVMVGGQVTIRMVMTLLPATLMALLVRPMLQLTGILEARRAEAIRADAIVSATMAERTFRLVRLDAEVRPYLRAVADGAAIDAETVARARAIDRDLRDEVRGRGWWSEPVRHAAAAARDRGVAVRLLDDSTAELGADDVAVLHGRLIEILDDVSSGAVTARLEPDDRPDLAVITVVCTDGAQRYVWRRGGDGFHAVAVS